VNLREDNWQLTPRNSRKISDVKKTAQNRHNSTMELFLARTMDCFARPAMHWRKDRVREILRTIVARAYRVSADGTFST